MSLQAQMLIVSPTSDTLLCYDKGGAIEIKQKDVTISKLEAEKEHMLRVIAQDSIRIDERDEQINILKGQKMILEDGLVKCENAVSDAEEYANKSDKLLEKEIRKNERLKKRNKRNTGILATGVGVVGTVLILREVTR